MQPEKYAPPPPPAPNEILDKAAGLLASILEAPPDVLKAAQDILQKGASEIRKGPIPK